MRIERIEGNRSIRVLLTHNDLSEMNINIRTLSADSPELHSFLFKVMDYIKEETGFNAASGQIVVEASPADGGIILTVTKVVPDGKTVKPCPKNIRVKKKTNTQRIYRFYDFSALTAYFENAKADTLSQMKLYELEGDFFIISATEEDSIAEFAVGLPPVGTNDLFFSEHGKLIAECEGLLKMAEEAKKLK